MRLIFGSKNLNAQQRQRRLQAVLEAVFGADSTLHGRKRSRRALAVATDASTARLRPFVFRSFAPPEVTDDFLVDARAHEVRIVDALLSSAAAPTSPCGASTSTARPDGCSTAPWWRTTRRSSRSRRPRVAAPEEPAKAVGKEDAQLDLVVSLGTARRRRGRRRRRAPRFWGCCRRSRIPRPRDFVSGIIDLLTDTDATHDLVRRQLRDTWPSLIQERYHRLDASSTRGIWAG